MHEMGLSLTAQMAVHILAMNVAAPALILFLHNKGILPRRRLTGLTLAAVVQIAAIWVAHAPGVIAHATIAGMLLLHIALFAIALWFWQEVLAADGDRRWRAALALLMTAKIFCLLGALMVFAPHAFMAAVEHQQAAGLLMLVACPITYLLAAGVITRRWLLDIEARPAQPTT